MHDLQFFQCGQSNRFFIYLLFFIIFPLKLKTETPAIINIEKKKNRIIKCYQQQQIGICILAFLNMINIYSFISNITKLWIHDIETQHHINTFS